MASTNNIGIDTKMPEREAGSTGKSYWFVFRLVFVLFSLYLMADAFYRWDGFKYYAPFSEFLPSVALASILWSIVAILTALLTWTLLVFMEWFCKFLGLKLRIAHLLLFTGVFILFGVSAWKAKKIVWPYVQTTLGLKLTVFIVVVIVSVFITLLFRDKAERCMDIIQERITPLVWLFGMFVILSIPLVTYHAWWKQINKTAPQKVSQAPATGRNNPNIILVTFDALAAQNMSVYGYHMETTPFIDGWAKTATVFTRAEAESNYTTPTTASLMTGKRVWTHQTYHLEGTKPVRSHTESLPSLMKDNGYYTMAFVVNPHTTVKKLGISNSFDIAPHVSEFGTPRSLFGWKFGIIEVMLYELFGDKIRQHDWILKRNFILNRFINIVSRNFSETTVPPEKAFNRFLDVLDDSPLEPYFAWIHIFPPHDPYLPPDNFKGGINSSLALRTFKDQEKVRLKSFIYLFQHKPLPEEMQPTIELLRNYYDEFIGYIDKRFEDFINELKKRKIENTVIILSADHGESFEHGYFTHGGPFLYEQVTQIPLIIKEPGQKKGQIINDLVEQIDIPATILDLADIPAPSWMEGRSIVPLMNGERLPDMPAFSMNFEENPSRGHQITRGSIAVWEGNYKLIHYLKREESQLFNLKHDPDELINLFDSEPKTGQRLLGLIYENLRIANEKIRNNK